MLKVKFASKYYPSAIALENVAFSAEPGEVIGLFGSNAAGKSTLLRSIAGIQQLSYGEITVQGKDAKVSDAVSLISDGGSFFPDQTAAEHGWFYQQMQPDFNQEKFRQLLAYFHLPADKPIGKLSHGQQGKMEICIGFSRQKPVLLVDEPFLDKDMMTRADFIKLLAALTEPDQLLIIATHLVNDVAPLISRALLLKEGHLTADMPVDQIHAKGLSLSEWLFQTAGYQQPDLTPFLSEN